MDIKKALEIKKAIILIETELNVPVQKLGSLINLYNESSYKKLMDASKLWNEFDMADIKERGKMLGYNIALRKH